ncbi:hypothetical protein OIO90_002287 [Microbotryomycetes sp. JL221]|nr:hypothetical protein OIO90_002287 [Microbotryomycetes sp. JL221]
MYNQPFAMTQRQQSHVQFAPEHQLQHQGHAHPAVVTQAAHHLVQPQQHAHVGTYTAPPAPLVSSRAYQGAHGPYQPSFDRPVVSSFTSAPHYGSLGYGHPPQHPAYYRHPQPQSGQGPVVEAAAASYDQYGAPRAYAHAHCSQQQSVADTYARQRVVVDQGYVAGWHQHHHQPDAVAGGELFDPFGTRTAVMVPYESARASANVVAAVDHDHPSFDKPPHRSNVNTATVKVLSNESSSGEQPVASHSAVVRAINGDAVEYDLVANVSPVPPPPPIERSAVPLADLAAHMVWEACALGVAALDGEVPAGANALSLTSDMFSKPGSGDSVSPPMRQRELSASSTGSPVRHRQSHPHTPELYGAIGDGRMRKVSRMSLNDGYISGDSSPGSSAPGTPGEERLVDRRRRLATMGLFDESDDYEMQDLNEVNVLKLDDPVDPVVRSTAHKTAFTRTFPVEPTSAFRQFVRQVLTATLVAPEDLILALYYVARTPSSSILPPTTPEPGSNLSAEASAIKAAPFKIILGALMLANKTLQDNSYRNETFAAVSGIPLRDVNELEIHLYAALNFDTAVDDSVWRSWLEVVVDRSLGRGNLGHRADVHAALRRMCRAVENQQRVRQALRAPVTPQQVTATLFDSSTRPVTPPNPTASAIANVNLDASGPLESPLHQDGRRRLAPPPPSASPVRWSRVASSVGNRYNRHELSNAERFHCLPMPMAVNVSC